MRSRSHSRRDNGKYDPVERVELGSPVDPCRFHQGGRKGGQNVLPQEKYGAGGGNGRYDQRNVGVHQMEFGTQLVKTDEGQLSRDHHEHQNGAEDHLISVEFVHGQTVSGQSGKVHTQ